MFTISNSYNRILIHTYLKINIDLKPFFTWNGEVR